MNRVLKNPFALMLAGGIISTLVGIVLYFSWYNIRYQYSLLNVNTSPSKIRQSKLCFLKNRRLSEVVYQKHRTTENYAKLDGEWAELRTKGAVCIDQYARSCWALFVLIDELDAINTAYPTKSFKDHMKKLRAVEHDSQCDYYRETYDESDSKRRPINFFSFERYRNMS